MRIGASFPTVDFQGDSEAIRHWAESVEVMGFDHLVAIEHVVAFNGLLYRLAGGSLLDVNRRFDEPFVLFGFLAAVTRRVELVTGVLVLPQRQTVLVAKQAAEVDVLSGGRLRLGIGVGGVTEEYAALDQSFNNRGRRSEEQIAVLRALWTEQPTSFSGRWHRLQQAGINPLPVQRPIPIWMGGHADAALRRVGRLADGWIPLVGTQSAIEQLRTRWQVIQEAAREAGRDPASIGFDAFVAFKAIPEGAWPEFARALQDLGVTHLTLATGSLGGQSLDEHLATLNHIRDELIAAGVVDQAVKHPSAASDITAPS